jgi:hypothetical protein
MTRDEAVAMIKLQLRVRTDSDTNIITALKMAQQQLELLPTKPWFLISLDSYITTVVDERRVNIPDDFLSEIDEAGLNYIEGAGLVTDKQHFLKKAAYDTLVDTYGVEEGEPKAYALVGDLLYLFPLPDDEYIIRMIYYKKDTVLSNNVENGWLKWAPYLLMGEAGLVMSGGPLRDKGATDVFTAWKQQGLGSIYNMNEARMHANVEYQIGGPEA